jgi:hypothetical protein
MYLFSMLGILIYLNNLVPLNLRLYAAHDDYLMVNRAFNLLEGLWMGEYDQFALAKDLGFSVFLYISSKFNISYINATTILLFSAILLNIYAIQKIIKMNFAKMILIATPLFLFPIQLVFEYRIIYRDLLIATLILILLGLSIYLVYLINDFQTIRYWMIKFYTSTISLSLFFTFLFHIRGKTPSAFVILVAITFFIIKKYWSRRGKDKINLIFAILILLIIPMVITQSIMKINEKNYGVGIVNDYSYGEFPQAMKSISRLKPVPVEPFIAVSTEQREKAYAISSKFSELSDIIEAPDNFWKKFSCDNIGICDDISTGWIYWAIRDAASQRGYFKSLEENQDYFREITSQITNYCKLNPDECTEKGVFEFPQKEQISYSTVMKSFTNNLKRLSYHEDQTYRLDDVVKLYSNFKNDPNILKWERVLHFESRNEVLDEQWTRYIEQQKYINIVIKSLYVWMFIGLIFLVTTVNRSNRKIRLIQATYILVLLIEILTLTFIESNIWGNMGINYLITSHLILWVCGFTGWLRKIFFQTKNETFYVK